MKLELVGIGSEPVHQVDSQWEEAGLIDLPEHRHFVKSRPQIGFRELQQYEHSLRLCVVAPHPSYEPSILFGSL